MKTLGWEGKGFLLGPAESPLAARVVANRLSFRVLPFAFAS